MTQFLQSSAIDQLNQRSLMTLTRSILFSQEHFTLILVRCNYLTLQQQMGEALQLLLQEQLELSSDQQQDSAVVSGNQEHEPRALRTIHCQSHWTSLLTPLLTQLQVQSPLASLNVFGLESVQSVEQLLVATNQVRDEFRKNFGFPLVLWVTDEVLHKLTRFAPDFKSWAAASIKFEWGTDALHQLCHETLEGFQHQLLQAGATEFQPNENFGLGSHQSHRQALEFARKDLLLRDLQLPPEQEGCWQFLLGRDAHQEKRWAQAIQYYQQSLNFWELAKYRDQVTKIPQPSTSYWQGIALFHLGLGYCHQAQEQPRNKVKSLQQARDSLKVSLHSFPGENYPQWIAQLTIRLGEVLQSLEHWDELQQLVLGSLNQLVTQVDNESLATAYGFLAQIALARENPLEASSCARMALEFYNNSEKIAPQKKALYLFFLALALDAQSQERLAQTYLEQARTEFRGNQIRETHRLSPLTLAYPELYHKLLERLQTIYFHQGKYRLAFALKQEGSLLEQQSGKRAFLGVQALSLSQSWEGAGSQFMATFGRQQDIQVLLERLSLKEHKLILLHGLSGVGKTALLQGLLHALKDKIINAKEVLPLIQSGYRDWEENLRAQLPGDSLGSEVPPREGKETEILEHLQHNSVHNCFTVLIFDQFEECFMGDISPTDQERLYHFLASCLNLPFVKVIVSIGEEYLHHLLEWEETSHLEVINGNILDKKLRYRVKDLTLDQAQQVISHLSHLSGLHWQQDLIEGLTQDLARERGSIRPLELQMVGAQLQEAEITTYQDYQRLGDDPQNTLLKRSLESVIQDCGQENEDAVWQILFGLTNDISTEPFRDRLTRPLRTKAELLTPHQTSSEVRGQASPHPSQGGKRWSDQGEKTKRTLDLILDILIGSGLVVRLSTPGQRRAEDSTLGSHRSLDGRSYVLRTRYAKAPHGGAGSHRSLGEHSLAPHGGAGSHRYQLVHHYLVEPIRNHYNNRIKTIIEARLHRSRQEVIQAKEHRLQALGIGIILAILALGMGGFAIRSRIQQINGQLMVLDASSEVLFASDKGFEALLEAVRTATKMRKWMGKKAYTLGQKGNFLIHPDTYVKVVATLEQARYGVQEKNRLEGHQDIVWGVSITPNGQIIASGSLDQTIKLWHLDGRLMTTLTGHRASITAVTFNPQGNLLASSSRDGTVLLWTNTESWELLRSIETHQGQVYQVQFDPEGKRLVTSGQNGTVKTWSLEGTLLSTLDGHRDIVLAASWSPDGKQIVSADKTGEIRVWQGSKLLRAWQGHNGRINQVVFAPQGGMIATASTDHTAKLWTEQGELKSTLKKHTHEVLNITWNHNGEHLATAGNDNVMMLWTQEGQPINTFAGHSDGVTDVKFSPDGQWLITSSYDKTLKLWPSQGDSRTVLRGHQDYLRDIVFSPDGKLVATASEDHTVKLWSRDGQLLTTLQGHQDEVHTVSFSPDGQYLASGSYDQTIKLWRRSPGGEAIDPLPYKTLQGHQDWVLDVNWSQDSQLLASGSKDKTVKLWTTDGQLFQTLTGHQAQVNSVGFSHDGGWLVSGSDDHTLRLWFRLTDGYRLDLKKKKGRFNPNPRVFDQEHSHRVLDVTFSPDGKTLATASYDNQVNLWNYAPKNGITLQKTLNGHHDSVSGVSFSPKGEILATSTWDSDVQLWRTNDILLKTLKAHSNRVARVTWSPDGNAIATASYDNTGIIWNMDLDDLMERSCDWLENYFTHNNFLREGDQDLCDYD